MVQGQHWIFISFSPALIYFLLFVKNIIWNNCFHLWKLNKLFTINQIYFLLLFIHWKYQCTDESGIYIYIYIYMFYVLCFKTWYVIYICFMFYVLCFMFLGLRLILNPWAELNNLNKKIVYLDTEFKRGKETIAAIQQAKMRLLINWNKITKQRRRV